MKLWKLQNQFEKQFGKRETQTFFAPGRINLIGEHTDYNGGNVFPCAITLGTYGIAAKRNDTVVNLFSTNFPETGVISFDIKQLEYEEEDSWANYLKGVMKYLKELQTVLDIKALCDLDEKTFEANKGVLSTDTLYRREKHAVTENQRTLRATKALKAGDLKTFGHLMNESHLSTENDYEVTGIELDTLVHSAWK